MQSEVAQPLDQLFTLSPTDWCLERLFMSPGGSQPGYHRSNIRLGVCAALLETSGFRCSCPPQSLRLRAELRCLQELNCNLPGPQAVA